MGDGKLGDPPPDPRGEHRHVPVHLPVQAYVVEHFPPLGPELLRIGEAADLLVGIEDDRGRVHRSGERSPPRLVAAGNRGDAPAHRCALASKSRP